jgi:uncharacterized membrane protein YecN with MAPEG domain
MHVTPVYAALLGLLFFVLSVRTLRLRRKLRIAIGDAGNQQLLRAMRVHSNFAEYVPLTLLLVFLVESGGAHSALVHALCLCLLLGRLAHGYGVGKIAEDFRYRIFGMAMTFTALVGSAAYLLLIRAWRLVA